MYVVKKQGIYAVQLADQIDPNRTNPSIPDTQQRLMAVGADDPTVARIFLTAHTLLKKTYLGKDFNEQRGLELSLEFLKDVVAMTSIQVDLEASEGEIREKYEKLTAKERNLRLPSLGNAESQFDAFAQKAGHAVNGLEGVARLFYGKPIHVKWIDSLVTLVAGKYGEDSGFTKFLRHIRPFLLFVLEMRNLVEHPRPERHIKVHDFRLLPSGEISPPSLEIVRLGEETGTGLLVTIMKQITEELVSVAEMLLGHLCSANVQPIPGFPIQVVELPVEQRANKHVRLSYGFYDNAGKVFRFG